MLYDAGFASTLQHAFRLACRGAGAATPVAWIANLLFLLIYLLAPLHWSIWHWRTAGLCGAAGGAILGLFVPVLHGQLPAPGISILTAATGGFTCLLAALLRPGRKEIP